MVREWEEEEKAVGEEKTEEEEKGLNSAVLTAATTRQHSRHSMS